MIVENRKNELESIQRIIIGTAGLAGLWGSVSLAESIDTILLALEAGVNQLDTAPAYSQAEKIVSLALSQWQGPNPKVSTKCGRLKADSPYTNNYDYSPEGIHRSFHESLETLKLSKIDTLFLHDPISLQNVNQASKVIEKMLELKEAGLVNELGIGGNYPTFFEPFVTKENFSVFMGYNRYNAICIDASEKEHFFLNRQGIQIWQASPLYNGLLGSKFKNIQHEKPDWIPKIHLERARRLYIHCVKNGFKLPEIAIRFIQSNSAIEKVVIGAVNKEELRQTIEYWKKGILTENEIKDITKLQKQ